MKHRVHVSWLIAWLCLGILAGIALSGQVEFGGSALLIPALVCLVVGACSRKKPAVVFVLVAGICLGVWRGAEAARSLGGYIDYYGKDVEVSGTIAEDSSFSPEGDQRLRIKSVSIDGQAMPGVVWVSVASEIEAKRGDQIGLSGKLSEGFGGMAAAMYRAKVEELISRPYADLAREARDGFASGVRRAIPEPQASLGLGLLTGQKTKLPEELLNALRALGLTHIIVASGYNLTILAKFSRRAFSKVSRYLAAFTSATMIAAFTLVTGFSPSMSRAALVAGLTLLAWYYGRRIHPLVLLPMAAAVTAYINPSYIRGDIGWYLSFTAFAGVMILAPLAENYFWGEKKKPHFLRSVAVETLSAQILTLPVSLVVFGQYSLLALPANILILPLIPLVMLLTLIAGIGGLIAPTLGTILGYPAVILLSFIAKFAGWAGNLPGAKGELSAPISAALAAYLLVIIAAIYLWRRTRLDFLKTTPD